MTRVKRQAGAEGIVFELTSKGDGFYDVFYTLDMSAGTPPTVFPMLLDTGSSDTWIAVPPLASVSYSPPSSSTSTNLNTAFSARYLFGGISGHLYADTISIGPYTLSHQALCAAEQIENESLGLGFSGILGFGLGGLSAIQNTLEAASLDTSTDGRGAPVLLNMFDPTVLFGGSANIPRQQWFAIVLDRPGFTTTTTVTVDDDDSSTSSASTTSASTTSSASTTTQIPWNHAWPARLSIGAHVDEVVHAFSNAQPGTNENSTAALEAALQYLPLVTTPGQGTGADAYTHWKTRLSGITIYLENGPQDVRLTRGVDGGPFPVAVLDSGGANVYASRAVADAIYSVWGVSISDDGNYYVPCNQPLNITITLATSTPIPIHPLDMSTFVHNDRTANPTNCLGTIQTSDMLGVSGSPADIALGISFMRNVYTIHQLSSPTSPGSVETTNIPRLAVAPLTNPTLALKEFQNVRVLDLTPSGAGRAPPPMTGTAGESLSTASKILLGVGLFLACIIVLFAARWFVLRRRFARLRAMGKLSSDGHGPLSRSGSLWTMPDGVAGVAQMIRRKTTLRAKKRRKEKERALGGWRQVSEVGHEEGLEGAVATKSAIGHGGERSEYTHESRRDGASSGGAVRYANAPVIERPRLEERQASGPFAGFSLWTFVGAKRLLGPRTTKGNYARTANPSLGDHELEGGAIPPVPPIPDGLLTEDDLRAQRYAEHQRRQKRENESSIWSDVTWVDRGDGTFVPAGTVPGKHAQEGTDEFGGRKSYAYAVTPNETVVGSTTNLVGKRNDYGFPKGQGDSDDESTEKGSTLHDGAGFAGKLGNREGLPLLSQAIGSTASLPQTPGASGSHSRSGSGGQAKHGPYPPLELHHPPRMDSSGIITASPYPMTATPGGGTPPFGGFGTPPFKASATPPSLPSTPKIGAQLGSDGFNPYFIPATIPAAPQPQSLHVHPPRERMALAVEPSLSPLTEVNSSEFPSTNRMSILNTILPAGPAENRASVDTLGRQSSIFSTESEVLVPLPISLMKLPQSSTPPPLDPTTRELLRGFDFSQTTSPPKPSHSLPTQRTEPMSHPPKTSYTLPTFLASTPAYQPAVPVPPPPVKHTTAPPPPRANNPFDLLALDDFALGTAAKDSRFPSIGPTAKDSRFPTFAPPRQVMTETSRLVSDNAVPSTFVAVPDEAARPRLRTRLTDMEPRPQSEAIGFGAGSFGPVKMEEKPWMKPRSQSGGSASLPAAPPAPQYTPPEPPAMQDFTPPHEYRPTRPEQRTLPVMPSQQRSPPHPRNTEPANTSMGARSRGPRPMVAGPRSSRSTGSSSSTQSPNSPPGPGTRQGTNHDSPASLSSLPSASSPGATSSTSSFHPGARAPSDPRFYHQLPSIPGSSHSSSNPSTMPTIPSPSSQSVHPMAVHMAIPPAQYPPSFDRPAPSRSTTTEEDPEAAYGGMETGGNAPGWREEAAKTAGVAGVGARSRFTGAMDSSPFDDRS